MRPTSTSTSISTSTSNPNVLIINVQDTKFNITVDISNITHYKKLFHNITFTSSTPTSTPTSLSSTTLTQLSELFKYYLTASTINEKDKLQNSSILLTEVDNYFNQKCFTPNIKDLYTILFKTDKCYRSPTDPHDGFVGVCKGHTTNPWQEVFYNIGMKASDLDHDQLQRLVNYYYSLQKHEYDSLYDKQYNPDKDKYSHLRILDMEVIGFIFYLLYERIHPHHDGNGRIGRLLFIENTHNHVYFPLSVILSKLRTPKIMQDIHDKVNFTYIHNRKNGNKINYINSDEYYKLHVDDSLLRSIYKCLCICKEFKSLYITFKDAKRLNAITTTLLRKNPLTDDKAEAIINDDDLFDKFNNSGFDIDNHNLILQL